MLSKEQLAELRRKKANRLLFEQEQRERDSLLPGEDEDLILTRALEHYDEDGWQNAPDYVVDAALTKKGQTRRRMTSSPPSASLRAGSPFGAANDDVFLASIHPHPSGGVFLKRGIKGK